MKKLLGACVAATVALIQVPAHAQDLNGLLNNIDFTFGGYGTIGTVRSSTDDAQFVRGTEFRGATQSIAENVDSNLGVQGTARFNSWLSVTAQALWDNDALTDSISWAYVKVDPLDSLSIKLGKMEMPLFQVSDSRDINYANNWLRPPNEVYSLAGIEELTGGEISYTLPLGVTHLTVTGYGGNSFFSTNTGALAGSHINAWDVHGGELRWDTPWVGLRYGIATTENEVAPNNHDKYTFESLGATVDRDNIVAMAEWVKRYDVGYAYVVDSIGWYVFGGYHIGKLTPYASYATTTKSKPYLAAYALSEDQDTTAVGVRWDAFKSADIKFQLERVDPRGTDGASFVQASPTFGNTTVTVASLTLDFIF